MLKFITGTVIGAVLAYLFVQFNVAPPSVLKLPEKLRGTLVATAVEAELYDLSAAADVRVRALKVYFSNRAQDAAKLDAESGHPFLNALHRARARREARQILALWGGYDKVLAQPALREALIRKHKVSEDDALKLAMLVESFRKKSFLVAWLHQQQGEVADGNLLAEVRRIGVNGDEAPLP